MKLMTEILIFVYLLFSSHINSEAMTIVDDHNKEVSTANSDNYKVPGTKSKRSKGIPKSNGICAILWPMLWKFLCVVTVVFAIVIFVTYDVLKDIYLGRVKRVDPMTLSNAPIKHQI